MESDECEQLITILPPETTAEFIEDASTQLAAAMIEGLDSSAATMIMEELQTDTQADIVQELDAKNAESVLAEMDFESDEDVRKLTQYDPDTAGGLMELGVLTLIGDDTVGTVLQRMITGNKQFERCRRQHPYIIDESGRLVGVVSLRGLLRSERTVRLSDIMYPVISVMTHTSQD